MNRLHLKYATDLRVTLKERLPQPVDTSVLKVVGAFNLTSTTQATSIMKEAGLVHWGSNWYFRDELPEDVQEDLPD